MASIKTNAKRRIREIRKQRDEAYEKAHPNASDIQLRRVEQRYRLKAYSYLHKRGLTVEECAALVKPEFDPGRRT